MKMDFLTKLISHLFLIFDLFFDFFDMNGFFDKTNFTLLLIFDFYSSVTTSIDFVAVTVVTPSSFLRWRHGTKRFPRFVRLGEKVAAHCEPVMIANY